MPRHILKLQILRILLLLYGIFTEYCDSVTNRNDAPRPQEEHHQGKEDSVFFPLRSCHHVMHEDSGEFFSPDYLCSNPPLWCNWTIQVDPGKRVRLYLEDFTPAEACQLKRDQVLLDEPLGVLGGQRALERCWHQAKYTSLSNTLRVVLLIGGSPLPPHRGFYARYQAFGPPIAYKGRDDDGDDDDVDVTEGEVVGLVPELKVTLTEPPPLVQRSFTKYMSGQEGGATETVVLERPTPTDHINYDVMYDDFDNPTVMSNQLPWKAEEPMRREAIWKFSPVQREEEEEEKEGKEEEEEEVWNTVSSEEGRAEERHMEDYLAVGVVGNYSGDLGPTPRLPVTPPMSVPPQGTSRSGRQATRTPTSHPTKRAADSHLHTHMPSDLSDSPDPYDPSTRQPGLDPKPRTQSAMRRNIDGQSQDGALNTIIPLITVVHPTTEYHLGPYTTEGPSEVDTQNVTTLIADQAVDDDGDDGGGGHGDDDGDEAAVNMTMDEPAVPMGTPVPMETQEMTSGHLLNVVEPLSNNRRRGNTRNHTETAHLPGDYLFEVAVQYNWLQDPEEHWDQYARSLLMSTKALIHEELESLQTLKVISSKRIKRLSEGVLYILWLQIGEGPEGLEVHQALHSALQGLIERVVSLTGSPLEAGSPVEAAIVSVSTADVNECGTQLVLCDINAECVNRFGSYACHCRPGLEDVSRFGSGGTLCVDPKAAGTDPHTGERIIGPQHSSDQQHHNTGCATAPSTGLLKGIYIICFLLTFLILLLLCAVGVLYHRNHRGAFLVRCHSSSLGSVPPIPTPGRNNNNDENGSTHSELPPPPPPIRRPKEGWTHPKDCCPSVDLPLLRFSPLKPLDGYLEPDKVVKLRTQD